MVVLLLAPVSRRAIPSTAISSRYMKRGGFRSLLPWSCGSATGHPPRRLVLRLHYFGVSLAVRVRLIVLYAGGDGTEGDAGPEGGGVGASVGFFSAVEPEAEEFGVTGGALGKSE